MHLENDINDIKDICSYIKKSFNSIRESTDIIVKDNVIIYLE